MLKATDEWDRNRSNVKNWVLLRCSALVNGQPTALRLRDHLIPFENSRCLEGLLWAAYGHNGSQDEERLAMRRATQRGLQVYRIKLWYPLRDLDRLGTCMDRDDAHATGFLHMDRLSKEYRDEVRMQLLDEIEPRVLPSAFATIRVKRLSDLVIDHPECVRMLLSANPWLKLVAHPVHLEGGDPLRPTYLGTFRADGADGIKMLVQHLEDEVTVTI